MTTGIQLDVLFPLLRDGTKQNELYTMDMRLYLNPKQHCWPAPYLPTCSIAPYVNWNAIHKFPRRPPHFALKSLTRVGLVRT